MRRRAFLFLALAAALAFSSAVALAAGGGRWGGSPGYVRGPNGIWRYQGPNYPGPQYEEETPFMDCYAYDAAQRRWVRLCN